MTPAELFTRCGQMLCGTGPDWKAQFGRALNGIKPDSIDAMTKGKSRIPPGVWLEVAGLLQDFEQRMRDLPALRVAVTELASKWPPRIYEWATDGYKFTVRADPDGTYPEVAFQDGTGFWETLTEHERTIPAQAHAFRLQRGNHVGDAKALPVKG